MFGLFSPREKKNNKSFGQAFTKACGVPGQSPAKERRAHRGRFSVRRTQDCPPCAVVTEITQRTVQSANAHRTVPCVLNKSLSVNPRDFLLYAIKWVQEVGGGSTAEA